MFVKKIETEGCWETKWWGWRHYLLIYRGNKIDTQFLNLSGTGFIRQCS